MNVIEIELTKEELDALKQDYCISPSDVASRATIKNVSLDQCGINWIRIATRGAREYFASQEDVDAALYPENL